jgi:FkbH-like protein
MLLCLCSRNNPGDVQAVFKGRPQMRLREEHVIASRVNWGAKSASLRALARELGLSLDSFIFIDDNALECEEVRTHCPSVLTMQFPDSTADIAHFLDDVWAFDRTEVTDEATRRTFQYRENRLRETAREEATDLNRFFPSLELQVDVMVMRPEQLPRVAELVQRTNQFNLTTHRRSASEIASLCDAGKLESLAVCVRDRFGGYDLVGALLYRSQLSAIEVDIFVLSCRVLGRGVEHHVIYDLAKIARAQGLSQVVLKYTPTERNLPAWQFLESTFLAFQTPKKQNGDQRWESSFAIPVEYAEQVTPASANGTAAGGMQTSAVARLNPSEGVAERPAPRWQGTISSLGSIPAILEAIEATIPRARGSDVPYVAPRSPTESSIADIWGGILKAERVGIRDNFFTLGGDSLQAVRAISAIGSVMGLEISLYEFFEGPTIEAVAKALATSSRTGSNDRSH